MHTTWRASVAHGALGAAILLGIAVAAGLYAGGGGWPVAVAVLQIALTVVALAFSLLQHRKAERLRQHLTTELTHHLRTSLAHVRMFNEMLLLGRERDEEERQKWLEVVGREAERLGCAVENILLILRLDRTDPYPVRSPVDLGALLEDLTSSYVAEGRPRFQFPIDPPRGIVVDADPVALRQAITNLLDGVCGGCDPSARLSASLSANGGTAMIVVGVDRGSAARSPNGHVESTSETASPQSRSGVGLGLELAVAQHVARAHGGRAEPFRHAGIAGYRLELPLSPLPGS